MSPSRPSRRLRAIQYGVLAQMSVICLINYMDRTTLAIAQFGSRSWGAGDRPGYDD